LFIHHAFYEVFELRGGLLTQDYGAGEVGCPALNEAAGRALVEFEPEFPCELLGGERDSVRGGKVAGFVFLNVSAVLFELAGEPPGDAVGVVAIEGGHLVAQDGRADGALLNLLAFEAQDAIEPFGLELLSVCNGRDHYQAEAQQQDDGHLAEQRYSFRR
jgi:hypothetical protein